MASEYNYFLDDWDNIHRSFAYDYGIILNKKILLSMKPQSFFNLATGFSSESPMGRIWQLENADVENLTSGQQNFLIERELKKNKGKQINSLF